jgi:CubicO group peptidase (beta-lactamase class C family)
MVTDDAPTPVRPDTATALLARVARAQVEGRAPSLLAGVVRDGSLVWSAARGSVDGSPPTADTQYRIGSITKPFTAVLVMRLRDDGQLDLDDRVDKHVSGTAVGDRTIRELLAHSGGLAAEPPGPWWERSPGKDWPELAGSFTSDLLLGPPGAFHYSNPGYAVLGEIVARRRGRAWYDVLREEVLHPLGMTRTTYDAAPPVAPGLAVHPFADVTMPEVVQDLGAMAPAGQLWSTLTDLARWVAFIAGDTGDVISQGSLAEMRQTRVIADDPEWKSAYGLGFQVLRFGPRELVGHGGSVPGYLAFVAVDVERRTGLIELANATTGAVFSGYELLEVLEAHEPHVPDAWQPVGGAPADLLDALGVWHWGPSAPYVLRLHGSDQLELTPIGVPGRASRFEAKDGDWVGTEGYWRGERLRVVRRADGSVSHLDLATFMFTRLPYDPSAPIPGGVSPSPWSTPPGQ